MPESILYFEGKRERQSFVSLYPLTLLLQLPKVYVNFLTQLSGKIRRKENERVKKKESDLKSWKR